MLHALRKMFGPPQRMIEAGVGYIALLNASRNPFFFDRLAVPDTLNGRFEVMMLHLSLLQYRLQGLEETSRFAQDITDECFDDFDRALREMGILNPGRRLQRMSKAYHGRVQAYSQSLADRELLKAALARNLYGTVAEGDLTLLDDAAHYTEQLALHLAATADEVLLSGGYMWPNPAALLAAP